jgi:hypothetical protein
VFGLELGPEIESYTTQEKYHLQALASLEMHPGGVHFFFTNKGEKVARTD